MTTEIKLPRQIFKRIEKEQTQWNVYHMLNPGSTNGIIFSDGYLVGAHNEAMRAAPSIELLQSLQLLEYNVNGESFIWQRITSTLNEYYKP